MDPNLVGAAGMRDCANEAEFFDCRSNEAPLDMELSLRRRAGRMNHLLQPDDRLSMLALSIQRGIDNFHFPIRPAPDDREIFFL